MRDALPETQRPSYGKCYRLCKENHLLMHKRHPNSLTKADSYTSQNDDLVRRNFTAPAPGTKYISDMTEIKCADGKLYLAAILDCFDGAVVGYAMRPHMRASLCCDAFRNAVSRYGYQTGLILHSDHGSQYTSQEYRMLEESEDTYLLLFRSLQERGLRTPRLVISDAHSGLVAAIRKGFPGQAGRGVKCTSCATFWRMCPAKRKIRLPSS